MHGDLDTLEEYDEEKHGRFNEEPFQNGVIQWQFGDYVEIDEEWVSYCVAPLKLPDGKYRGLVLIRSTQDMDACPAREVTDEMFDSVEQALEGARQAIPLVREKWDPYPRDIFPELYTNDGEE